MGTQEQVRVYYGMDYGPGNVKSNNTVVRTVHNRTHNTLALPLWLPLLVAWCSAVVN